MEMHITIDTTDQERLEEIVDAIASLLDLLPEQYIIVTNVGE